MALEERVVQAHNRTLFYGIIIHAVRRSTKHEGGRVIGTVDTCIKREYPVRKVLQGNHPPIQEIDTTEPIKSTFDLYENVLDAVTHYISGSDIEVLADQEEQMQRPLRTGAP